MEYDNVGMFSTKGGVRVIWKDYCWRQMGSQAYGNSIEIYSITSLSTSNVTFYHSLEESRHREYPLTLALAEDAVHNVSYVERRFLPETSCMPTETRAPTMYSVMFYRFYICTPAGLSEIS